MNLSKRKARLCVASADVGWRLCVALVFLGSSARPLSAGERWPEFRGPDGTGISNAKGLPIHWSETENVRWKTPIHGKGWSSPVVWDRQIWLTTATVDGKERFAVCVDRDSGKILHDIKVFEIEKPQSMGDAQTYNSYASPTPVIEAGRVYVHFGSAGTACLETTTGKVLWSRQDLPCNHHRGAGSSPILFEDLLILTLDGFDQQYLVALDKTTGKTRWKQTRSINYPTTNGDLKKAFSTPAIFTINGQQQLVSPSAVATIAYNPQTGAELWKVYHGGMNAAARPVRDHDLIFICTADGGPYRMIAVRTGGSGDITKTHVAWKQNRGIPNRSSPLVVDNLLYMVSDKAGVASCLDPKTGTAIWQQRLEGEHVASPVYADGRLYFFNRDGIAHVLAAGREAKILARNHLDDGCMATPAIAGKELYVRTTSHLYRIEQTSKGSN